MNFEEKELYVGTTYKKEKEIELRKDFGWEYVKDTSHGRTHALHIVLQRDKNMPHYSEVASLERQFDDCLNHKKTYSKIIEEPGDLIILIGLFLLFIFPLVIYCIYKNNQKKAIIENNIEMDKKMKLARAKAAELVNANG